MVSNRKLADAYRDMESDLRHVRRLARLARRLYIDLLPGDHVDDHEELGALIVALEAKVDDVERQWDEGWVAAGGKS